MIGVGFDTLAADYARKDAQATAVCYLCNHHPLTREQYDAIGNAVGHVYTQLRCGHYRVEYVQSSGARVAV